MRMIHLHNSYAGRRTNEVRIAAGNYQDDDPILMGLAAYLVENGHARYLEPGEMLPIVPAKAPDSEPVKGFLTHAETLARLGYAPEVTTASEIEHAVIFNTELAPIETADNEAKVIPAVKPQQKPKPRPKARKGK